MTFSEKRINETEAADILGLSKSWLQKARLNGDGPPFSKLGRAVRYSLRKRQAFMDERE